MDKKEPQQSGIIDADAIGPRLRRHFVSLALWDAPEGGEVGDQPAMMCSGFVVSVMGHWYWVTAGHVLAQIDERLRTGRRIVQCRLFDKWSGGSFQIGIPVGIDEVLRARGTCEGIDYAVLPLTSGRRAALEANGVEALDESKWFDPPSPGNLESCFLVGTPYELNRNLGELNLHVGCAVIPVSLLSAAPPNAKSDLKGCIDARLLLSDEEMPFVTIEGTSGGPLFGVSRTAEGTIQCWVLGIQSSWHSQQKVIHATPLLPVLQAAGVARRLIELGYSNAM